MATCETYIGASCCVRAGSEDLLNVKLRQREEEKLQKLRRTMLVEQNPRGWLRYLSANYYYLAKNCDSNYNQRHDFHERGQSRQCIDSKNTSNKIIRSLVRSILTEEKLCQLEIPFTSLQDNSNLPTSKEEENLIAQSLSIDVSRSDKIDFDITEKTGPFNRNENALINSLGGKESQSIATHCRLKSRRILLLLLLIFIFNHNAPLCLGFGYFERSDNNDLVGSDFPYQSPSSISLNPSIWNQFAARNRNRNSMRQLTFDPLNTMSTSLLDSFSNQGALSSNSPDSTSWMNPMTQETLDAHIKEILVPRASGTQGNINVRNYIVKSLRKNNYHIELDEFADSTPIGKVKFANIIATSNPNACRHLVLACHYDSKMMDGFLGAIDSAVPCAMLLEISETFGKSFRSTNVDFTNNDQSKKDLGLMFIFFDGEEAFDQWGPTDSLYGSRHLAEKWHKQPALAQCAGLSNRLATLELFVLLDLIGTSDTSFVMYSTRLKNHYNALQQYERAHLSKNGLTGHQLRRAAAFTNGYQPLDFVQDDHVPFKKRGVPILSLLAYPFPKVWHTTSDNYSAIDFPRTKRILSVLEEFVAKYQK